MERTAPLPAQDWAQTSAAPSLGAELRESLLLLTVSIGVTAGVTVAAHTLLSLLG